MKIVGDNFYLQAFSEPGRQDALLDFVIRKDLGDVVVGGCLGHSDHETSNESSVFFRLSLLLTYLKKPFLLS